MPAIQSKRSLVIEFTKMSGAGNDFIVIDNRFYHFSESELIRLSKRLCRRKLSIGADGLLAFADANADDVAYVMIYFNADGSRGSMCGNGARCLGRFARLVGVGGEEMTFDSDVGHFRIVVPEDQSKDVRLYMPDFSDYRPNVDLPLDGDGGEVDADFIWTGTEHLVCWVKDVETFDVSSMGPRLRSHPALGPAGANVNFSSLVGPGNAVQGAPPNLKVRTYEKGVEAETLACGTGALAVTLSAIKRGEILNGPVSIEMPGGTLTVGFRGSVRNPQEFYLEGGADTIFRGTVEIESL